MKEKIIAFFTDVVKEMKKVTWPKKDDLRDSTVVVLVVCLIIAGVRVCRRHGGESAFLRASCKPGRDVRWTRNGTWSGRIRGTKTR